MATEQQGFEEGGQPPLGVILASNVYTLRKEQGIAQEKLAYRAGLTRETLRVLEKMRRQPVEGTGIRLSTVDSLASVLGVEPWELLRWHPERTRVYLHRQHARLRLVSA